MRNIIEGKGKYTRERATLNEPNDFITNKRCAAVLFFGTCSTCNQNHMGFKNMGNKIIKFKLVQVK